MGRGQGIIGGALLALALALSGGRAEARDPAFGHWLVENGRAIVEIYRCGAEACGRIAWLAEPRNADGRLKTDLNNPDPGAQSRALCGLPLIEGLSAAAPGAWDGGEIYNARDGGRYSVRVTAEGPDRLEVRGYVGLSLLGSTQVWTRVAGDRGGCLIMRTSG